MIRGRVDLDAYHTNLRGNGRMGLFNYGNFTLHSGVQSRFIIDAEALTDSDLDTLALMAINILPKFSKVVGVPRGGIRFATVMEKYLEEEGKTLVVDDVLTSGASMYEYRFKYDDPLGLVIFARRTPPLWITALMTIRGL